MGRRRYRRRAWLWVLAAALGDAGALGCQRSTFACSSDDECVDGSMDGICQPTGWCSFEDPECPSMQRYGEHSGEGLAGTCVPAEGPGSSGPDVATTMPPISTTANDEPPLEGSSGPDATSLPPPVDTGHEDTSGRESGGTTEDPPEMPPCEVVLYDDFDDGRIDGQWNTWADPGTTLEEADSMLRFSVVSEVFAGDDSGVSSEQRFDLTSGHLRIELTVPPTPATDMQFYWQLQTEACTLTGLVENGSIYAFDQAAALGEGTAWLQVRFEDGLGSVDRSADGVTWEPVFPPSPVECAPEAARVYVFGGVDVPSVRPGTAAVGTVEACGALAP